MSGGNNNPGRFARFCAMAAAVLLTASLTVTLLCAITLHGLTSEDLHIRAAADDESVSEQMDQISAFIGELADDYGFGAEEVTAAFSAEELKELNREVAAWWTRMINEGVLDPMPEWSSENVRAAVMESVDETRVPADMSREDITEEIVEVIRKRVREITMPVRRALLQKGFQFLRKRVDPADAVRFLSQGTAAAAAGSLVLAGLIALLTGKRIRASLRYFGAALAGAGIASIFGGLVVRSAGVQSMIGEVSKGLSVQASYILRTVTTEGIIAAAVLLAGGILCLILDIRDPACRRGEYDEKKQNRSHDSLGEDSGAAAAGSGC